uniref:Uncharacterized protein n=1 Tax=Rhizophora mucronata TaxID=61149 RepID=A0A2P2P4X7_RHIMU
MNSSNCLRKLDAAKYTENYQLILGLNKQLEDRNLREASKEIYSYLGDTTQ